MSAGRFNTIVESAAYEQVATAKQAVNANRLEKSRLPMSVLIPRPLTTMTILRAAAGFPLTLESKAVGLKEAFVDQDQSDQDAGRRPNRLTRWPGERRRTRKRRLIVEPE